MQKITRNDRVEFLSKVINEMIPKSSDLGILAIENSEVFLNSAFKFVNGLELTFPIDISVYNNIIHLNSRVDLVFFMYRVLFDTALDRLILTYKDSKQNIVLNDDFISKLGFVTQMPLDKSSCMPLSPLGIKIRKGETIPNPVYNMIMRKAQDILRIELKIVINQLNTVLKRNEIFASLNEEFDYSELIDDNALLQKNVNTLITDYNLQVDVNDDNDDDSSVNILLCPHLCIALISNNLPFNQNLELWSIYSIKDILDPNYKYSEEELDNFKITVDLFKIIKKDDK